MKIAIRAIFLLSVFAQLSTAQGTPRELAPSVPSLNPPALTQEQKIVIFKEQSTVLEIQLQMEQLNKQYGALKQELNRALGRLGQITGDAAKGADAQKWALCSILTRIVPGCTKETDLQFIALPRPETSK